MKKLSSNSKRKLAAALGGLMALNASTLYAVEFGAMADISYSHSDVAGVEDSFALGVLDLYAAAKISPNTHGFIEYVFEDLGGEFGLDLERLYLARTLHEGLEVGMGRYHTNLGYWNSTYHHGALLQDTVSRPGFLEFEDDSAAIMPMHIIGLSVSGGERGLNLAGGTFNYDLTIGNSASVDTTVPGEIDVNNTVNHGGEYMVTGRATFQPGQLPLQVGVFHMSNPVVESASPAGIVAYGEMVVSQMITGFDLHYGTDKFDALAEYYAIRNDNKTGALQETDATAYFVQLGYRITAALKPVYRYEALDFEANDDYYNNILQPEKGARHVLGLRWDLDDSNALKVEMNKFEPDVAGADSETVFTLQWAFMML